MRFLADRAVAHCAGLEPFHDFLDRLDFLDGDGLLRPVEFEQAAQRAEVLRLVVDQRGVFLEPLVTAEAAGELQLVDGLRVEQVELAIVAPLILAAGVQRRVVNRAIGKCLAMAGQRLFGQHVQTDALDARHRPGEIPVNDIVVQSDGLKNLRAR